MRLSVRRNVDLPQPDGPIKAMTERSGIEIETLWRAWLEPYQNDRPRTSNLNRSPLRSGECQPLRLRSEMIAE